MLASSQVWITSNSGSVNVGARWGGYSGGVPQQGYNAEILSNGTVKLWRISDWTQLGSTYTISGFSLNTWYTLALRANGNQISVEVNGSTVIGPVTGNASWTSGDAGLWSYQPSSTGSHRFDNFSVTVLGGGVHTKTKGLAMIRARTRAVVSAPPANTTWRVYYYANGKPIAMRVLLSDDNAGTLYYLHSDHLGSTSVTTCGNTACGTVSSVFSRQRYYPYGEIRPGGTGTQPTTVGFTGQRREDAGLGSLMFFQARYFSPTLGRFLSADSVVPDPSNPQALNRYAFVLNNPLRYTDPSGHQNEPTNQEVLQQAVLFFQNLGWTLVGDLNAILEGWNGADIVFTAADGRVLAVEVKNVTGSINLGTLGSSATYGDYGGSLDRIIRQAERFQNSEIEQLRLMSQAILQGRDAGTLENALFASSKATSVSDGAAEIFDGVYRTAQDGTVTAQKVLTELSKPDRLAQAAAAYKTLEVATYTAARAIGKTLIDLPIFYLPAYMIPDYLKPDHMKQI